MTESGTPEAAVGDDPDAPWRPGYTGPEPRPPSAPWSEPTSSPAPAPRPPSLDPWSREADSIPPTAGQPDGSDGPDGAGRIDGAARTPIDPAEAERAHQVAIDEAPTSDGRGLIGVVGVLVAVGLVIAALVTVGLINDGEERASALPTIPEAIDERWSADAPGVIEPVVVGGAVVARTPDELVAFDADDGAQLWSRPSADDAMLIEIRPAGEVLLFLDRSADSLIATGVDPMTGDELWNRNVAERREVFVLRDRIIEYEFEQETQNGRFAILSPETGLPLGERLQIVDVATAPPFISATTVDTDEVVLLDIVSDERIAVPLDWEEVEALAVAGGRLLALTEDGSLALYDDAGENVDEIDVTLGPDQDTPENIFAVPGEAAVVMSAGGSSVGVAIDGDALDIRWSAEGVVQLLEMTDAGPRAILVDDEFQLERSLIVDPIAGETVFEVETNEYLALGFESETFGRNGLVYVDDSKLVALDDSGETLWELDDPGSFVVADGLLVVFDGERITVYG